MIVYSQSEGEKATLTVVLHLIPLAMAFLVSLSAIYTLLNTFNRDAGSKQQLNDTPPLLLVQSPPPSRASLSTLFTAEILHWTIEIERWAIEYELDPNLIASVMQIESCGHPNVTSSAGALGLFQVMPFHFANGEDPFDPAANARRGLRYLSRALELAQGDVSLAMAGYNGGHAVIEWDSSFWQEETIRYVYWASGIYADINIGADESPRLAEWLAAGGTSLCSRAAFVLNS